MLRSELELCVANHIGARFEKQAASLNVSASSLYAALVADAENAPPNFDLQGRQVDTWKQHRASHLLPARLFFDLPASLDYLPVNAHRTAAGSVHARVVSRALEVRFDSSRLSRALNRLVSPKQYAFDDFTISQVAKILGNRTDAAKVRIPLAEAFSRPFINLWSSMRRELGTLLTIGIPTQPCPTGHQVSWE